MEDYDNETTTEISPTTIAELFTDPTTTVMTLLLDKNNVTKRRPCENLILHDGNLYVCFEKINFLLMIATLFFILFILFAVLGNLTVILAILREKRLRTPSSYLILSLAVTDLIVGGLTVPMRALNEVLDYGTWHYGATLCDIRVVIDKICVYSSLLHVLIIAIDRYRTVSNLNYSLTRSGKQIFLYVFCVWTVSFMLAAAPMFGWRDGDFKERIKNGSCFVNTLFSLNFTVWLIIFVIPCTVTAILYIKVFLIIKSRLVSNKSTGLQATKASSTSNFTTSTSMASHTSNGSSNVSKVKMTTLSNSEVSNGSNSTRTENNKPAMQSMEIQDPNRALKDERKRSENKASKTLILITICIVVCWSPFFTLYTISSIFKLKTGSTYNIWFKMSIWLGYSNSICNMTIYAFMNPNYSRAIKNLLKLKF